MIFVAPGPLNFSPAEMSQGEAIKTELLDDIQVLVNISRQGLTLKSFIPSLFFSMHPLLTASELFTAHKAVSFTNFQLRCKAFEGYLTTVEGQIGPESRSIESVRWCVWCNNKPWSQANVTALFLCSLSQKLRLEINHFMPEIHSSELKEKEWVWANFKGSCCLSQHDLFLLFKWHWCSLDSHTTHSAQFYKVMQSALLQFLSQKVSITSCLCSLKQIWTCYSNISTWCFKRLLDLHTVVVCNFSSGALHLANTIPYLFQVFIHFL